MSSPSSSTFAREVEDSEHWLSATDLLAQIEIRPGMTVADIGAGIACYSLPIAHRVGSTGRVFAVEWRPWLIQDLRAKLADPSMPGNVRIVSGRAADTRLPASSCDIVLLADIWHELDHQNAALDEARRILREGGQLAILNWRPDALCPPGPPIEHRISMDSTIWAAEMRSWSLLKAAEMGVNGYLLVFEPTDESVQS